MQCFFIKDQSRAASSFWELLRRNKNMEDKAHPIQRKWKKMALKIAKWKCQLTHNYFIDLVCVCRLPVWIFIFLQFQFDSQLAIVYVFSWTKTKKWEKTKRNETKEENEIRWRTWNFCTNQINNTHLYKFGTTEKKPWNFAQLYGNKLFLRLAYGLSFSFLAILWNKKKNIFFSLRRR